MKLSTKSFRGMAPRLTPRALPDNGSQEAINARLLTGDLEAWKRPELVTALYNAGIVRSIFLLNDTWLSSLSELEYARSTTLGDTSYRTFITGMDVPRWTNYEIGVTQSGGPPYPVETRPLGVPAPDDEPTVSVANNATPANSVAISNPGAESGTSDWVSDTGALSSLSIADVPSLAAYQGTRYFSSSAANTSASQELATADVRLVAGSNFTLTWHQARGPNSSTARLGVQFLDDLDAVITTAYSEWATATAVYTWEERSLSAVAPRGAVRIKVLQEYTRVGGGATDAYVDAITMVAGGEALSWDGSSLEDWTTSPNTARGAGGGRIIEVSSSVGNPAPSINMDCDENCPWMTRDFQADTARSFTLQYDLSWASNDARGLRCGVLVTSTGAGVHLSVEPALNQIMWGVVNDNSQPIDSVLAVLGPPSAGWRTINQWLRVTIAVTVNADGSATATVTVKNAATNEVYLDEAVQQIPVRGGYVSFSHWAWYWGTNSYWDNISYTAAPVVSNQDDINLATSYVFTYVNDQGEESAPSNPSETVIRGVDASVTVTTPTTVPTGLTLDYNIETKRIYRAVTGAFGSVYRFVAEIPLATADYVDTIPDSRLGEELESTDWDLPPDDLRYILALPNGIMVGASGNQLCLSAQNHPHAWPVAFRLPTDSQITGLANVDNSVVIGTRTFVYTASGNTPDTYTMSKPGAPHACMSARSMAYLLGIGAVFAGPDGLMAVNGPTDVRNLTEGIFTREQWQALDPSTIIGIAHDDVYFFFYGGSAVAFAIESLGTYNSGGSYLSVGAGAMVGDEFRVWLGNWSSATYSPRSFDIAATSGGAPTAAVDGQAFTGTESSAGAICASGASDVPCALVQITGNTYVLVGASGGAATTFSIANYKGNETARFARRGSSLYIGGSAAGDQKIDKYATTGGSVVASSAALATYVEAIAATDSTVYALASGGDTVYTLDASTMAAGASITTPEVDSQASLITRGSTLYFLSTDKFYRWTGAAWELLASGLTGTGGANRSGGSKSQHAFDGATLWTARATVSLPGSAESWAFYSVTLAQSPSGLGYALDMKPTGFGLIELGMHASAVAQDFSTDSLCMVLDDYDEPTGNLLPNQTGSEIVPDGTDVYEWNAATGPMRYSWRGKLWLNPHPKAWQWVRVRAEDYDDLEIRFTVNGATLYQRLVTSDAPFRLPLTREYDEIDVVAIGTSRVRSVEIADDVTELE